MAKQRSSNYKTIMNLVSSMGVLVTSLLVSFLLSPYIIRTIGVEANGFISLATNFTTYAGLVVMALNAMAARFITISYVNKDYQKANIYYNSVFWGNLIIVAILLLPSLILVFRLNHFIDIPTDLTLDVKILFGLVFLGFFLKTGSPNWDCGTIVTNRLDRYYIPNIVTALLRCGLLIVMFWLFTPRVWFVSLTSLIITIITLVVQAWNTHKLTPELKIKWTPICCSATAIKELVGSGIWNSIASSGNMLMVGLDLLVCNVALGATSMGLLSISKSLPNIFIQFTESIRGVFGPELTIQYAKGDKEGIVRTLRKAMKLSAVIVSLAVGGIVVMSDAFYALWLPSQDAKLLQTLTVLAVLHYVFISGTYVLANVFPTTNNVRYNAVSLIISGAVSILTTIFLIQFTDWDLYAVAGVSSVVAIIRNLAFLIPCAAKFLGLKWYTFYPEVGISVLCFTILIVIGHLVRAFMPVNTWSCFFVTSAIIAVFALAVNVMIVLKKDERAKLFSMIKHRFHL